MCLVLQGPSAMRLWVLLPHPSLDLWSRLSWYKQKKLLAAPLLVWISAELQLALQLLFTLLPLLSAGMIGVPPCGTYLNLFCGIILDCCRVSPMHRVVLGEEGSADSVAYLKGMSLLPSKTVSMPSFTLEEAVGLWPPRPTSVSFQPATG